MTASNGTKLLTAIVPCYNSAEFMRRCIDSLLEAHVDIDLIIVDDGSTDDTPAIADAYAQRYPSLVRVIHQENGGWGEAINQGIAAARGTFLIEVDSDDHVDPEALRQLYLLLKRLEEQDEQVDLVLTNFVYDQVRRHQQHAISYRKTMPRDRVFTWDVVGRYGIDGYIMIHAACYRTSIYRDSDVVLPKHMSYMDSYLLLHPLPYVRRLYYLDVNLYYYTIGRDGQSIEIPVLKKHIDEQLEATKMAISDYDYYRLCDINPKMAECFSRYIAAMMSVSTVYLFYIDTPESLQKCRELWAYLKENNPGLHRSLRFSTAWWVNRKTPPGRMTARAFYTAAKHLFKFA